jgi:hypothetical protein
MITNILQNSLILISPTDFFLNRNDKFIVNSNNFCVFSIYVKKYDGHDLLNFRYYSIDFGSLHESFSNIEDFSVTLISIFDP